MPCQEEGNYPCPVWKTVNSRRGWKLRKRVTFKTVASLPHTSPAASLHGSYLEAFGSQSGSLGALPCEKTRSPCRFAVWDVIYLQDKVWPSVEVGNKAVLRYGIKKWGHLNCEKKKKTSPFICANSVIVWSILNFSGNIFFIRKNIFVYLRLNWFVKRPH